MCKTGHNAGGAPRVRGSASANATPANVLASKPVPMSISTLAEGRFLDVNGGFVDLTGYHPQDVLHRTAYDVRFWFNPEDRRELLQRLEKEHYSLQQVEFPLRTKSGRKLPVKIAATSLDIDDQPCLLLAYRNTLAKRRRGRAARDFYPRSADAGLSLTQRESDFAHLARLAATGRLAAQTAHEINNPLAGIRSSFQLIRRSLPDNHPDRDLFSQVETEIDRIAGIVREMLDLHRPIPVTTTCVSLAETAAAVTSIATPHCAERGVRLQLEAKGTPSVQTLTAGAIRQVLFNLINNALDASDPGGKITLQISGNPTTAQIVVIDQGHGIPQAVEDRVFDPFFSQKQGSASGGLGLGLAITKELVESAGGTICFISRPEKGTIFCVTLPTGYPQESPGGRAAN